MIDFRINIAIQEFVHPICNKNKADYGLFV